MSRVYEDGIGYGFRQMSDAEADAECYRARQEDAAAARAASASIAAITPQKGTFPPPLEAADASDVELDPELRALLESLTQPDEPAGCSAIAARAGESEAPSVITGMAPVEIKAGPATEVRTGSTKDFGAFPLRDLTTLRQYDDPLQRMRELCRQLLTDKDYAKVRDDYCHLSIMLNLIGKLAPAFRPKLKPGAALNNVVYQQINRDQVVIDLHWCYAIKMPLMPRDARHAVLLCEATDFSFDTAWTLASMKWKKTYRAGEALCLTTFQQCQMLKLCGPELEERIKSLESGWRDSKGKSVSRLALATQQVTEWAERDGRIFKRRDDYLKLWLARELLGHSATHQELAKLHALMLGTEVKDRTTIRDMLKSLNRNLPTVP